jgi:hypothetical protein
VITSSAEREASLEFAKANAIRPSTLGAALKVIAQDPVVANALFEVLETQKLTQGDTQLIMVPSVGSGQTGVLTDLLAASRRQ